MVQRVKGKARAGRRGPASGVRTILLAHRRTHFGAKSRWALPGGQGDDVADAVELGLPVIMSSSLLWSALQTAGMPNDGYGIGAELDGRYWLVDEFDVFEEWTDPHPAEDPERAGHCAGGRTCGRCDPEGIGVQTVDIAPARQVIDWTFIEWADK
jgi:hypothetical protein